jgi:hypothetical protein
VPVTVATLLGAAPLGLTLYTRGAAVDRAVSWVHVSELADPTPFLEGGELLLTTGLALASGGADVADYVRRLAEAGVVGLGLGTGLSHAQVPADLVAAADAHALAVLEVPRATPFIAISRAVSAALAAEEYAAVARTSTVQQELTRAAVAPGAPATVVDRLARHLGGWALLVDAAGSPLEAAPHSARGRAGDLAAAVDRLRGTRPPAGAALTRPGESVLLQSLGTGSRTRGFLAVGRPGPFPAGDRHVVNAAALLLTLRLEQSRALDSATAALRAALLRLLLAGEEPRWPAWWRRSASGCPPARSGRWSCWAATEQRAAAVDVAADAARARPASRCSPPSSTTPSSSWWPTTARSRAARRPPRAGARRAARHGAGGAVGRGWPTASGRRGRPPSTAGRRGAADLVHRPGRPGLAALLDRRPPPPSPRPRSRRWSPPTGPAPATWSSRCGSGSPRTASGSRPRPASACTGTRCASASGAPRSCWPRPRLPRRAGRALARPAPPTG